MGGFIAEQGGRARWRGGRRWRGGEFVVEQGGRARWRGGRRWCGGERKRGRGGERGAWFPGYLLGVVDRFLDYLLEPKNRRTRRAQAHQRRKNRAVFRARRVSLVLSAVAHFFRSRISSLRAAGRAFLPFAHDFRSHCRHLRSRISSVRAFLPATHFLRSPSFPWSVSSVRCKCVCLAAYIAVFLCPGIGDDIDRAFGVCGIDRIRVVGRILARVDRIREGAHLDLLVEWIEGAAPNAGGRGRIVSAAKAARFRLQLLQPLRWELIQDYFAAGGTGHNWRDIVFFWWRVCARVRRPLRLFFLCYGLGATFFLWHGGARLRQARASPSSYARLLRLLLLLCYGSFGSCKCSNPSQIFPLCWMRGGGD